MATNTLHSIQHHHHSSLIKHHHNLSDTLSPSQLVLKPTKTNNITLSQTLSLPSSNSCVTFSSLSQANSSTTQSTNSQEDATISYDPLSQLLSNKDYKQADEETRRLLIALAGEAAVSRGYVFFSEVKFISESDLKTIDKLWREHSGNKFGYSVQKKVFEKTNKDFTKFFIKVGWMKKLDTEMEQWNYRSFPSEFIWELDGDTPEGHLPLTNALRGTRLLQNIFNHPAFDVVEGEGDAVAAAVEDKVAAAVKPLDKRVFKTDYSF